MSSFVIPAEKGIAPNGLHANDAFTVQATTEVLRRGIPPGSWLDEMAFITDGKSVGEAIRTCGPDLVYVRFQENKSGFPLAFTIPKQYLIPYSCNELARQRLAGSFSIHSGSLHLAASSPHGLTPQIPAEQTSYAAQHLAKERHDHVDLHLKLGDSGEPMLCVVCGRWDQGRGQKRSSGHKCTGCVGKASLPRLREEFFRLLKTEECEVGT